VSVHLPVVEPRGTGSIRKDGSRIRIVPADVSGRYTTLRRIVFFLLIGIYLAIPWVRIEGRPALLLDLPRRRFFLFGETFNAQDGWLLFFLLSGVGFALVVLAAMLGRVWCGYACPQTVFLEGVFRRIERLVEGPRAAHLRRDAGPGGFDRIWRKTVEHGLYLAVAVVLAHTLLAYFVTAPGVLSLVGRPPAEHVEAFLWTAGITAVLYLDFAFFREQLCVILCPYGRLQSVLADRDTVTIGYDAIRGEPRGKAGKGGAKVEWRGDCVDCGRCVAVCPTGIDIRNGQQLDCIGCAACIDACDAIMDSLKRPRGLVRYDSLRGLEGGRRRFLRPRAWLYLVLGVTGLVVMALVSTRREPFEANLLRLQGLPFTLDDATGRVRNAFEVHLVNKQGDTRRFTLRGIAPDGVDAEYTFATSEVTLGAMAERRVPVFVTLPAAQQRRGLEARVEVTMHGDEGGRSILSRAPLLGPRP
jgi:cytochrome c oxidase accessory protein FixG